MRNRISWPLILLTFVIATLSPPIVLETSAAGPYEYLILNQSEASALGLDTVQITDNSAGDTIDVRGEYTAVTQFDPSRPITFTVAVSHLSPTADISFETALANCTLCANPGWGNCRVWGVGFEKPCYSRFEDGYRDFGAYTIDRNFCRLGGTSVFSANGLKIIVTSERLNYGLTQEIWNETIRRHDEFANMIAHKIRTTYDPQTMTLTLVPLKSSYAPGESVIISGSVANTFDSAPIASAAVTIDINGTPFSTTTNVTGDFSVQFDIAADASSIGTYLITITASSTGYPDITEETYLTVEEVVLEVTVNTDKDAYAPGETVVIQGQVTEGGAAVPGATVEITVVSEGTLTRSTDGSGGYRIEFQIPADAVPSTFTVLVTATTATASNPATANTTFTVGQTLTVTITTDKDYYLIGDTVYCTIKVDGAPNTPIPYSDLAIKTTYLGTGRTTNLTGLSDALGENLWTFTWGEDAGGNPIAEGKLKIEVTATKTGYTEGSATITLSGCGDLVHNDIEDCLICEEDCGCGPNEECDPASDYRNPSTMCGPKVACIFISKGLGWYDEWWATDDIKGIRNIYKSKGYQVTPDIYVDDIFDVAKYLSRPSTKAIAYAGHSGGPWIENVSSLDIPNMINISNNEAGGFIFRCRYETYATKWVDFQDKIKAIADEKRDHPNLDYAFMFSCYSLDDYSLRDYLLKSGGTYWGYRGTLPGYGTLIESVKP